jgi:2-oxoglutarate ferredoxin oxidoreductase subunit alpha
MMRELPKMGGVAIQAEDELAAIGMCIGAAMSGARAFTATSGPGISLYSENIGLAIMGEVPLVIVDVQRQGPSTGGSTTVGQGDVQFVRWGTAGGYPLIALAPSSIPECYSLTMKAFDLAERFRCPVFLLTDKELNLTMNTVDVDQYQDVPVQERKTYRAEDGREGVFAPYRYHPPDAVPPMAHFGEDVIVRFTGSTHDERAFITKHPPTVDALNRHLAAKIEEHLDEIEMVQADLEPGARTLLISYGMTARAMREGVQMARGQGKRVSALTIQSLWPVPETAIQSSLEGVERIVVAELNLDQYRREIERISQDREILGLNRVDGELISPEQFLEVIR